MPEMGAKEESWRCLASGSALKWESVPPILSGSTTRSVRLPSNRQVTQGSIHTESDLKASRGAYVCWGTYSPSHGHEWLLLRAKSTWRNYNLIAPQSHLY